VSFVFSVIFVISPPSVYAVPHQQKGPSPMSAPAALITGASRSIGAAIAVQLAREGFDLAILGPHRAEATVAAVEAEGRRAVSLIGDVASAEDRARALDEVAGRFGRLDVLVNNAGITNRSDLLEATEDTFDRILNTDLKGPHFLTQAAARYMIQQRKDRPDDWMCVVNISSISAYTVSPLRGEYCIAKAGVSMATKLWATRLAEFGIGVYEIRPGVIASDMTAPVKEKYDRLIAEGLTPIRRWGQPADVARAVAVCARGELKFATGAVLDIDGGFHMRIL